MPPEDPHSGAGRVDPDPLEGRLVDGKYRIVRLIARGGMGRIYEASQEPLGRRVALKVLRPASDPSDEDFTQRFALEAATLARLRHGNTVTLFDFGRMRDPDTHFIVMELVQGQTLSELLRSRSRADPARLLKIAVEVCRSLGEAHELGVVHRDLKPSNIMVVSTHEGESVKVLDFGIAKLVEADDDVTQAGRIIGSPRYMAPEQVRGDRVDGRADIYALGVMLYEGLTGKRLFTAHSQAAQLTAHLAARVKSFEEHGVTDLPAVVEEVVRRCLEKLPEDRYRDVEELIGALRGCLGEVGPTESLSMSLAGPTTQTQLRTQPLQAREPSEPTLDTDIPETSVAPAHAPAPSDRQRRWWAVLVLVFLFATGLFVFFSRPGPEVVAPAAVAPAAVVPAEAPAPARSEARLRLRSLPPGAEVREGESVLGQTPLEVPLDPARPRRNLTLRLRGYQEATVVQERADADVEHEVRLVPLVSNTPKPRPRATPRPDDDLIMER